MRKQKQSTLSKMMRKEDRGQSDVHDPFAALYRKILADLGIGPMRWIQLLHDYCAENAKRIGRDRVSDYKGNLTKSVVSDKLSTYYLIRCLSILKPFKIEFVIRLHFKKDDGEIIVTEHAREVDKEFVDEETKP